MRLLPLILIAAILGIGGSFLVACGDRSGLLPRSDASALNEQFSSVQSGVDSQNCKVANTAAANAQKRAAALPATVDADLRKRLELGILNLQR
ncbi:MAG: hypothetical protein WCK06_07130, partial [Actinomycetota bacterium]